MPLNASNRALDILIFALGGLAGAGFYLLFNRLTRLDNKPKCGVQTRIVA